MKTLVKGRTAVAKAAAFALMAAVGMCATAHAQTTIDVNTLDPGMKTITCDAGNDQTMEAGSGTVIFHGTTTYSSDPPPIFLWENMNSHQVDEVGSDASEMAPTSDTTFRLVVLDPNTGNWGEDTFKVSVTDTTAPQIWLLGQATQFVTACTPYFESGWGVFDNADGMSVPVSVTGQVNVNVVGIYKLTYTATDAHNNSAFVVRTVDVIYPWTGFDAPVDPNGKSVFHINSTIPLKFALTGTCAGVTNLNAKLYLAKMTNSIAGTEIVPDSNGNADSGNTFKYSNGKYSFNLATKGLSSGTWQLRVDLGDGALHTYTISLSN